ncbi:hypothetical protein D9758_015560 [Tetrapyrgos nigripes]|uniref:Uncharacterized protein n=1 Tax=Tetrapyrgos nigripes TaxID=182062 RepID=A0A8H5CE49_9AGAR|nr:hypothetical protein D9758_015560 [Tetrapyrgos nigripes]
MLIFCGRSPLTQRLHLTSTVAPPAFALFLLLRNQTIFFFALIFLESTLVEAKYYHWHHRTRLLQNGMFQDVQGYKGDFGETVSGSIASTSSTTSSGSFTTIATTIVASTSGERLLDPSTSSESITAALARHIELSALARHIELFVFLPRSPTANYCIFTTMPSSTAQGEVGSDGAKDDSQQASGNEEDE